MAEICIDYLCSVTSSRDRKPRTRIILQSWKSSIISNKTWVNYKWNVTNAGPFKETLINFYWLFSRYISVSVLLSIDLEKLYILPWIGYFLEYHKDIYMIYLIIHGQILIWFKLEERSPTIMLYRLGFFL